MFLITAENSLPKQQVQDHDHHHHQQHKHMYFAICAIVKDELDVDLWEWIVYHLRMGCSKFYIFDHNSQLPVSEYDKLQKFISTGVLNVSRIGDEAHPTPQYYAYQTCLQYHRLEHTFIGFIDSDEFIVVKNKAHKIPDVLRRYEQFGGLVLHWKVFGNSGHVKRPPRGIIRNYKKCNRSYQIKTIANTNHTAGPRINPHTMRYYDGYYNVNTAKKECSGIGPNGTVCGRKNTDQLPDYLFNVMYINHYFTKSVEDFNRKMLRGNPSQTNISVAKYYSRGAKEFSANQSFCGYLEMPPA